MSVRAHDTDLDCDRLRGVGFSWRCTCGKRGRIYASREMAALAKCEHEGTHER